MVDTAARANAHVWASLAIKHVEEFTRWLPEHTAELLTVTAALENLIGALTQTSLPRTGEGGAGGRGQ